VFKARRPDGGIVAVKISRLDERAGKAFINEVST